MVVMPYEELEEPTAATSVYLETLETLLFGSRAECMESMEQYKLPKQYAVVVYWPQLLEWHGMKPSRFPYICIGNCAEYHKHNTK